jgi:hypothetical protein
VVLAVSDWAKSEMSSSSPWWTGCQVASILIIIMGANKRNLKKYKMPANKYSLQKPKMPQVTALPFTLKAEQQPERLIQQVPRGH